MSAIEIQKELEAFADPIKKVFLPRFFKTGEGEYGAGDKFLGVVVPKTRIVAKRYKEETFEVIAHLLSSEWHEVRLCALIMMCERFKKVNEQARREICQFYLSHTVSINNWDLVDLSAPGIVGTYLSDKEDDERKELYRLAQSSWLWDQRIAVVSTITFIRQSDFIDIIRLAEQLMQHPHDLMHKAIGWMLREMGKKNEDILRAFLEQHADKMPRTMLRYSIEKFDEEERQYFLKKKGIIKCYIK